MKIGFIGLGIMGKPMVKNLLKAGYPVMVNSRTQASAEEAAAWGAVPAGREQLGSEADVVITMVPNSPQVKELMQWLHSHGEGQKDHSAIAHYYEYLTGIEIGRQPSEIRPLGV